jgi:predicted dehydrogenase
MIEREKPDSVHVLLPNAAHREPVLFALAAGANVLCEKPIATSTAEAREMFDAAKAAGRTLMAAQSWRFESPSRAIKRLIDAGELGEIYYGEATAMRRMGIPMWGLFHYKEHSHGGALLDIGGAHARSGDLAHGQPQARPRVVDGDREVRQAT